MPDQTYLQQAQPSTFGHYVLSFAYPTLRDAPPPARRAGLGQHQSRAAPAASTAAACWTTGRVIADLLGFGGVIEHTRDAMWQVDGLINILATTASMLSNQSKLAEDLEIWSSSEFDYVDLDDGFTRSSVLMPQKRNPYSLSIVRGASGILIGRLSGFLAVVKSPSARSDNLIFAYGEVPRALDLAARVTRLMSGVVGTLRVNADRMADALASGFTQATDLAEHIVTGVPHRLPHRLPHRRARRCGRRPRVGPAGRRPHRRDARQRVRRAPGPAPRAGRPRPVGRARPPADRVHPLGAGRRRARPRSTAMVDVVPGRRRPALHAEADQWRASFDSAEAALLKLAEETGAVTAGGAAVGGRGRQPRACPCSPTPSATRAGPSSTSTGASRPAATSSWWPP